MSDLITQDDIKEIRHCAAQLIHLSAQKYTPADKIGTDYPQGVEADRIRAARANAVADKLERRLRA